MTSEKRKKDQRDWARKAYRRDAISAMLAGAKCRAKEKGFEFRITKDDLFIPAFCPVLGIPIIFCCPKWAHRPTVDRRDNSKGYIPGNVFVISMRANRIKTDATAEELFAVARYTAGD